MKNILSYICLICSSLSVFSCTSKNTSKEFQAEQKIEIKSDSLELTNQIDSLIVADSLLPNIGLLVPEEIEPIEEIIVNLEPIDTTKVYRMVEQMPQFPGGEAEMYSYISKNLKYPDEAIESGVQGRMIIRFVVHRSGKVINAEILKSMHPKCDSAALDVINNMPDWIPGKQNGQVVSVYYMLPIMPHFR
ncbi:energy transducer TonB [Dysgonomonas massiliensis]|uniref:energy transducer TonB n=1 Tax=Dysgonomonas massiliensis TaxID=2040292 RepID=UPI000C77CC63|nr:energy transducer TonB [Dysgonomonas massiliensis]